MTIDEAIKHCLEVAEEQEKEAEYHREWHENYYEKDCRECATEHRQLAEWLTELKQLKAIIAGYGDVNMQKLEMVLAMIRIGSEDAWAKTEREKELKEAKRLLKAAVEDFSYYDGCYNNTGCVVCVNCDNIPCEKFQWRYTDEALKLVEG